MSELAIGTTSNSGSESSDDIEARVFESAPGLADLRELAGSGALTGFGGAVILVRGVASLRRGQTGRGLFRLAAGGLLVGAALVQRRSRNRQSEGRGSSEIDQTDVTASSTDLEDVSSGLDTGGSDETDGDTEPADVVDTAPDVEGLDSDTDSDAHSGEAETDADSEETGADDEELPGETTTDEESR